MDAALSTATEGVCVDRSCWDDDDDDDDRTDGGGAARGVLDVDATTRRMGAAWRLGRGWWNRG